MGLPSASPSLHPLAQLVCVREGRARRALCAGGPGVGDVLRCSPSALPRV